MAKYSLVSKDDCIACGACGAVAPDLFSFDDDGYAENIFAGDSNSGTVEIPDNLESDLTDAAQGCPTEAIKIQDSPFNS
ncbi:MAG: ferredoxin [Turicibacter sp.]